MIRKKASWWALLSVLVLVLGTLGCSGGGEHGVAKAGGTVTMNGNPVPNLVVSFTPQATGSGNPGKSATGRTDEQGTFTLSTYDMGDGAIVGKHQVTVSLDGPVATPPGRLQDNDVVEVKPGSNNFELKLTP